MKSFYEFMHAMNESLLNDREARMLKQSLYHGINTERARFRTIIQREKNNMRYFFEDYPQKDNQVYQDLITYLEEWFDILNDMPNIDESDVPEPMSGKTPQENVKHATNTERARFREIIQREKNNMQNFLEAYPQKDNQVYQDFLLPMKLRYEILETRFPSI
jgi:ribosomal 50S subunit-associated protein YjgA (DUF615 family)